MYRWVIAGTMGSFFAVGGADAQEFQLGGSSGFYGGISVGGIYALEQTLIDLQDENDDVEVSTDVDAEYDFGYGFAGQIGYHLSPNFRTEAEIGYQKVEGELDASFTIEQNGQDITEQVANQNADVAQLVEGAEALNGEDVETSIIHFTIGAYYDLDPISLGGLATRPYLGGAVGFANTEVEFAGDEEDDTVLTVHGELGIAIDVASNLAIVPAYRFQYVGFDKGDAEEIYLNNFKIGARYSF